MGRLVANFQCAWQSLIEQAQRSLLSTTGIVVGSMAIVLLISIAIGVQKDVTGQVDDLGVNLLVVIPGRVDSGAMLAPNMAGLSYLKEEDCRRVEQVPGVRVATPLTFVGGGISANGKVSPMTFIIAANREWFQIHPVKLAEGRVFTLDDQSKPFVVIGSVAKKNLFGRETALGKQVLINGKKYAVVGVTEENEAKSSMFSQGGMQNVAYIPHTFLKSQIENVQIDRIMVQTKPDVEPKMLLNAVDKKLGERLDRQTYSVLTQEDILKLVFKLMGILSWLLVGLTSIALFIGGVGIMTVMWMSVNERVKEIGIRKTVGARGSDIFLQFLVESATTSLIGGLVGFVLSAVVCWALTVWTPIKPLITGSVALTCFGVCLGVGVVFGVMPALSAAKKDPVTALRNE